MKNENSLKIWEASIDQGGIAQNLDKLKTMIENAPIAVRKSTTYEYYKGFLDGRILHEELGGV